MNPQESAQNLLDFIDVSPSPWHVVKTIEEQLARFQFERLDETEIWTLKTGGRYF
ncbi:MAG: M18 family aminopeptidase, partial [Methylococcaceae bacterium]|nr:M18 family aminopeptidase [Methylococcaceae bacterium]